MLLKILQCSELPLSKGMSSSKWQQCQDQECSARMPQREQPGESKAEPQAVLSFSSLPLCRLNTCLEAWKFVYYRPGRKGAVLP